MEGYATATQLAGFYKLSKSQIYALLQEMSMAQDSKVLHIGKAVRVPQAEFERFLRERMERRNDNDVQAEISIEE